MKVSEQLYITAALLLGQETLGPTREDARWAPEPVWTLRRRKNLLPFLGIEPQFYGCSEQHEKNVKHKLSWKYITKGGRD
jgi:hypothetical protein